jgi:soluble lytic murein transglycosylase
VLVGVNLLAVTICVAAQSRDGTRSTHVAQAFDKGAKPSGKAAATKSNQKITSSSNIAAAAIPLPRARPESLGSSAPYDVCEAVAQPPTESSDADVAAVKRAVDCLRSGGATRATQVEGTISDPIARKLIEWIILRDDHNGAESTRYTAFIAANSSWPSLGMFRRRAEAMLWVEEVKPTQVIKFFDGSPPQSARGRLALARTLLAQGNTEGAIAQIREAWRNDPMSADLEKQVLESYSAFLSRADDKARMEKSLFAGDNGIAIRAASRLGGADLAIARARIALNTNGGDATKLQAAVPAEVHDDAGYIFAQVHVLRQQDKIAEAAQLMLSAPRDLARIYDPEAWWVERRILSRKLLDIGDPRSAYLVVRDAAEPIKENSRVERHFMAGWIALRFLHNPSSAAAHLAQIQQVSLHPTSLARSHYWLGRAAEAANRPDQALTEYQAAARYSAAYYGQIARSRLGLGVPAAAAPSVDSDQPASVAQVELVRALEILYALDERALILSFMADLGDKLNDLGALLALGKVAEQHQDARGMLELGKAALARGLPLDHYAFPTVSVPSYSPIGPGIDKAVLFAVIRQESAFIPDDLSSANAMGLMQVTPVAARDTCKRFGCTFDVKRLKSDTPYNLQLGAAELGGVLQEYRGNYILAFAAYNAGRGRVAEWIGRYGDPRDPKVDPIDWVERIPFMETRNYVQRVTENLQVYRIRFDNEPPLTTPVDLRLGAAAN